MDCWVCAVCGAVYKLSFDIDVAEIEQQVQDYVRQQVSSCLHYAIRLRMATHIVPCIAGGVDWDNSCS